MTAMPSTAARVLDEAGARALTNQIKTTTTDLCRLLVQAHDRKAWRALGYKSWQEYVVVEFHMSRQRAYQLLDQAVVIDKVRAAAEMTTSVDISEAEARDLKPHLDEVVATLAEVVVGVPDDAKPRAVASALGDIRSRATNLRELNQKTEKLEAGVDGIEAAVHDLDAQVRAVPEVAGEASDDSPAVVKPAPTLRSRRRRRRPGPTVMLAAAQGAPTGKTVDEAKADELTNWANIRAARLGSTLALLVEYLRWLPDDEVSRLSSELHRLTEAVAVLERAIDERFSTGRRA